MVDDSAETQHIKWKHCNNQKINKSVRTSEQTMSVHKQLIKTKSMQDLARENLSKKTHDLKTEGNI